MDMEPELIVIGIRNPVFSLHVHGLYSECYLFYVKRQKDWSTL